MVDKKVSIRSLFMQVEQAISYYSVASARLNDNEDPDEYTRTKSEILSLETKIYGIFEKIESMCNEALQQQSAVPTTAAAQARNHAYHLNDIRNDFERTRKHTNETLERIELLSGYSK